MSRTASEAGWHLSRYLISARVPDSDRTVIASLYAGICGVYTPAELYLLSVLETLDEGHPILGRFADRGLIVRFDERAALEAMGRAACGAGHTVALTVCPTMACNFDCPYCFESHRAGRMSEETCGDVVRLAERMLAVSGARVLNVTWFGGEPLLAPDLIESLSARLRSAASRARAEYTAEIVTNGYLLTPPVAEMLGRCGVVSAQVTLDGIGPAHDRTRHRPGGGGSFETITENLRVKLPFRIDLRHNVHEGNRAGVPEMKAFAERLAREGGNEIRFCPAEVSDNEASEARGSEVRALCGRDAGDLKVSIDADSFDRGRGICCAASTLYCVGIDERGRLHKCWEEIDRTDSAFGTAARWDPADPVATADSPENLVPYLNTGLPLGDGECRECVWLPVCAGGCPFRRLRGQKQCLPYRDMPEKYALALYGRLRDKQRES